MKTYYITGGTGFLGYNIIKQIDCNDNIIIFALENDPNKALFNGMPNVKITTGNLLNINDVIKFLSTPSKGDKYLIHAAGKITTLKKGDPLVYKINVLGTQNIVDVAKSQNFKKILYVSSVDSMRYRRDKNTIFEQSEYIEDETPGQYGKSKVLASNYVRKNLNNYIIVMPSAILGPDDPLNSAINSAIKKAINNKLPAIVNGGYNLVDVRDVARGILLALESKQINKDYLLTGHYIKIKDLMKKTNNFAKSKKYKFIVPHFIIKLIAPIFEISAKKSSKNPLFTGFSMDCLKQNANYSYQKAKADFNYQPRDIDTTIKDTIIYLQKKPLQ